MVLSKRRKHASVGRYKNIISYVLSVFVALSLLTVFWGVTIKTGLFNTDIVKDSLGLSGYYEYKAETINGNLKNMLSDAGIGKEAAEDVITNRMVLIDTNNYISGEIEGKAKDSNTDELEASLAANIRSYFEEQGITAGAELNEYINRFVSAAAADYRANITFPFISYYLKSVDSYRSAVNRLIIIPVPIILLCFVLLILMHRMKYRGIRYFGYGVCAASLLEVITSMIMKKNFMGIVAGHEGVYSDFIKIYISDAMSQGIYSALAGFILFGIIIIVTYYCRKKAV